MKPTPSSHAPGARLLRAIFFVIAMSSGLGATKSKGQSSSGLFDHLPTVSYIYDDRFIYRPGPGPWESYPGPWNPIHSIWISSFTASPSFVIRGQPVQLIWSAPGAQTVYIEGVGGNLGPSGAASVVPLVSTTYQLHAYGFQGQQVAASVYVQVLEPPARIATFQVNPLHVQRGESTYVSWNVEGCQVVQLIVSGGSNGAGSYGCSGQIAVQPQSQASYTLQAIGRDGQLTQSGPYYVSVSIPPPSPQIQYFRAQPLTVARGESTVLEWSVSESPYVMIMGLENPQQPPTGSLRIFPLETKTYVIQIPNSQGPQTESALTVTVENPIPRPVINRFEVNPPSVERGQGVTVSWQVDHCQDLTIEGISQVGTLPCTGSLEVVPEQSMDFRMVARNSRGQESYQSIYVPVSQPPAWPVIWNFRSDTPEIFNGQGVRLSWETTDAQRVELTSPEFTLEEPLSGTVELFPQETTTYELRAYNTRNQMTFARLQIKVRPPVRPSIESFQADQPFTIAPRPLKLSWRTRHCVSVEIPQVFGPFASNEGSYSYLPRQKKEDLILRCHGESGETIEASLTVRALPEGYSTDDAIDALVGHMGGQPGGH